MKLSFAYFALDSEEGGAEAHIVFCHVESARQGCCLGE